MTRFYADGFPWSTLPPTWHDPQTPAGEPSPVPGRHCDETLRTSAEALPGDGGEESGLLGGRPD